MRTDGETRNDEASDRFPKVLEVLKMEISTEVYRCRTERYGRHS
jgi:hypothetical protein